MQKAHQDYKEDEHYLDIYIICDNVVSPANIGGILRLADAYNVKKVYFMTKDQPHQELSSKSKRVSRGVDKWVGYEYISSIEGIETDAIDFFCLEITDTSQSISNYKRGSQSIGIIIGNENHGVSKELLAQFKAYHLKMYGRNSSMNVTNSLATALFYLCE